jgi:hypothetical protein
MKRILLLTFSVLFTSVLVAQSVRISWEEDYSMPYNGEEVTVTGDNATMYTNFHVVNEGMEATFIWRRDLLSVTSQGFDDQLCDDQICYNTSGNPWICPGPLTIAQNDSSLFQPKLLNNGFAGTAHIRYFVLDENENKLDSVDVIFTSTVSLASESNALEVKVFPNPAQNYLMISGEDLTKGSKALIVDALGKNVKTFQLNSKNNKLDISALKSGVYFVNVLNSQGVRSKQMKLIVQK